MPAPEALAQRKIGPFLLGRKLGAGGMATVYAAREETQHVRRLVALKVLSPSIQHDDAEHRAFLREAEIATQLEHPNIVRIFDVGEVDGAMYLAMELVHGTSLSALLKAESGPLPIPIALRIVLDLAGALHHAHELAHPNHGALGVVHQDVSPQNVLVSYEGTVKLVDFGVARLGTLEGSRTETLRGKPSYASPEQIAGNNIDRRTDVFALGVVAWELFTGERLFRRETSAATYLAVIQGPIPLVSEKNPAAPTLIAKPIAKALERERDARFKSAEAFRQALAEAAILAGITVATERELGDYVKKLVPPTYAKDELDCEIAATTLGAAPRATPKLAEAVVPDLDLPTRPATNGAPVSAVPELRATAHVAPASPLGPSAPDLAPRTPKVEPIAFGSSADDFDMEIERDVAGGPSAGDVFAPAHHTHGSPRNLAVASGLELAAKRSGIDARVTPEGPSLLASAFAVAVPLLLFGGTVAALLKVAHRPGGLDLLRAVPRAFDGSSVVHSGAVAVASLVVAFALGAIGLKLQPRSWMMVGSGGAMLLTALAMVTVTLASSGESPTPPDGALLVPYLAPLSLALLGVGAAARGRRLLLEEGVGRKLAAVPVAVVAGAVAFLALESSRLSSLIR